jgi:outer membrane biogenesis lipoprotein LolB
MHFLTRIALLTALLAMNACTSWQPPKETWALGQTSSENKPVIKRWSGHLSLKLEAWQNLAADGGSFLFDLQGPMEKEQLHEQLHAQLQAGQLDISTPLGTLMASIRWSSDSAVLHTPDGQQRFDSLDALLQQTLGEALPISTLTHWLDGHADPALPAIATADTNDTMRFGQAGWDIDAGQLTQGLLRATRTGTAQKRGARLVIRLDK